MLDDRGNCNLSTINLMAFVEDGKFNYEKFGKAQYLSGRASYRMTNVELELHEWNLVHKRDRLTGVSMTGLQDMINATNMDVEEQISFFKFAREKARQGADSVASEQGTPKSIAVTTCKPEGSMTQLPTVSSGVHFNHSEYYIRRVRINSHDPLVDVVKELGWELKPEVNQDMETADTYVLEFPIKAQSGKTKFDVSAIEQLEIYKLTMHYYSDHNSSITIHVRDNEWDDVAEWIDNNKDWIVAVSFISLDDSYYELMPYESINKETYEEMAKSMNPFNPSLLRKYESGQDFDLGDSECATGSCPIR